MRRYVMICTMKLARLSMLHIGEYDGIPVRVFSAEHLCAVALQTGRTKDYLRVAMFLEQGVVNPELLSGILKRYDLTDRLARAHAMLRDQ